MTQMGVKGAVICKGKQYRHILTVEIVFNGCSWLRSVKTRSSLLVYNELKDMFYKQEPPFTLPCDHRAKFKDVFKRLEKDFNSNIIRSTSHHPQLLGKIETNH